jgi:hypothetical protein
MDNLGAIGGPLLAIALVALVGTRGAIALSVIPGLLAAVAIVYAIRHTTAPKARPRTRIRFQIRPVLRGRLGSLFAGISAFEFGNCAATLLILRATELLEPGRSSTTAATTALWLYVAAYAPAEIRGSAFGLLAAVQSLGNFAASVIAGLLWTLAGPSWAFAYLAGWMILAAVLLTRIPPRPRSVAIA